MNRRTSGATSRRLRIGIAALAAIVLPSAALPAGAQEAGDPRAANDGAAEGRLREDAGGDATVARHPVTGKVRFFGTEVGRPVARKGAAGASPEASARAFLDAHGPAFGVAAQARDLRAVRSEGNDRGRSSVRFQQVHQGVPVIAGELVVNLDGANNVLSANGELLPDLSLDVQPAIRREQARRTALAAIAKARGVDESALQATVPELSVYDPALLTGERGVVSLVWRLEVSAPEPHAMRELVLVHAERGHVALHFDQLARAKTRHVCDRANSTTGAAECTAPYTRTEGGAASTIADVERAYEYSGITYDFFKNKFNRDSLDGNGMALRSTTRYCAPGYACPYGNAYWSGAYMVYGDGYASADDVVGHELGHGITDFTSSLMYYYQSGAINESLSDVWGELIDLSYDGAFDDDTAGARWLMGEDLPNGAIRSMSNPPDYDSADSMTSPWYWTDPYFEDNGGVHYNSGVNNKAAFLLVDGGSFNGVNVSPLGIDKTARVYYEATKNLLTSASDYLDLYEILQQSCRNLVGTASITTADCGQVRNAVTATRMNVPAPSASPDAPICDDGATPADLFFDNLENPASGNWTKSTTSGPSSWAYPQNPNAYTADYGYDATFATSGTTNMWGDNPVVSSDFNIGRTAGVVPPAGKATYLRFNHSFGFEYGYDGGMVEYSVDNGATWLDAGGLMIDHGYNGTNYGTSRPSFTGSSSGYGSTRLDLSSLAGQNVRYRFRIITQQTLGDQGDWGWFIDDVRVYTCGDPVGSIAVSNPTVSEGNSGSTPVAFTVTRTGNSDNAATVQYATAAGTAAAGTDYTTLPLTTLSFAAGETSKTVTVNAVGDTGSEANETFSLNLSNPVGVTIADSAGLATLVNDDNVSTSLWIDDITTASEGASGANTTAVFTIRRGGVTTGASSVQWATANGTAHAASDFTGVPATTVSFAAGETAKTVSVTVLGDAIPEADENFYVNLAAPSGAALADTQAMATILNDDAGARSALSINDINVTEGNSGTTAATFTVTRAGAATEAVSVKYATAAGSATGADFTSVPATTLSFAAGETSKTVSVAIVGDAVDEPNETVLVNLTDASKTTVTDAQGVATIVDDEGPVTAGPATFLRISDAARSELNSGTSSMSFTVTRTGVTTGASSATFASAPGSATPGRDFGPVGPGTVSFAAGETSKTVSLAVNGDVVPEHNESLTMVLSNPSGAVLSDAVGDGMIVNDDAGTPAGLSVTDVGFGEGNSGGTTRSFTVTRTGSTLEPVNVQYRTVAGTATADADFVGIVTTPLAFAAGETSKTVSATVLGDANREVDETFSLQLVSPENARIGDSLGNAVIYNDDALPGVTIDDVTVVEQHTGTRAATFTLRRSGDVSAVGSLNYGTADGTATNGRDYNALPVATATFAAGETAKTVTVTIRGDSLAEGNETVRLILSAGSNVTLLDTEGIATIVNDD